MPDVRTALVVHAHPDDEVFATGAATQVLARHGWHVVLRVATAGVGTAEQHLPRSCSLLGIAEWDRLGRHWLDDGGHAGPGTLAAADTAELADQLEHSIRTLRPKLILTVGQDGLTGHPDHVALAQAVRRAARTTRCRTLGARLRAEDVQAGHQLVRRMLPGEQVGSGRVVGCPAGTPLEAISGGSERRRRQALDQYHDGLGSMPLPDLLPSYERRGDSLLLRAVLDATGGWRQDHFEPL